MPVDLRRKIMMDVRQRRVPRRRRGTRKYSLGWDAGRARHVQQILPACRVHHGRDWPLVAGSLAGSPDLTRASCISVVDDGRPLTHSAPGIRLSLNGHRSNAARHATQGITISRSLHVAPGPPQLYR